MKKILAILLVFFYLGTTSGFSLHMHYCMGELIDLGLTKSDFEHCGNCGMEKSHSTKSGCCKEESKKIQTDDASPGVDAGFNTLLLSPAVLEMKILPPFTLTTVLSPQKDYPVGPAPPRSKPIRVYKLNCTYLI
ncbi:hypothetical protein CLV98_10328 [Dyadobacter jejuensis]|uniref:Uncharacterized protein n=1 Tax=Dyadobacter jejuensis TaxID=1082580 RepID=A0A316ALM7_9BACT|nr:hypothetical protein [Dyadobacter jejuensis]PWJ58663.1 hypothetical protein CLV98_10328 [Dyadobacter jejuensis]